MGCGRQAVKVGKVCWDEVNILWMAHAVTITLFVTLGMKTCFWYSNSPTLFTHIRLVQNGDPLCTVFLMQLMHVQGLPSEAPSSCTSIKLQSLNQRNHLGLFFSTLTAYPFLLRSKGDLQNSSTFLKGNKFNVQGAHPRNSSWINAVAQCQFLTN